jgi:hypothetical protein
VKETKPKLTHGGRRPGAGRPPVDRVRKTYKLDPWVIAKIQKIAEEFAYTESSVANELLWNALNMKLDQSTFARIAVSTKWGG